MRLLIFRHGIAEEEAADGRDESRRLTKEGIAQMKVVARGLVKVVRRPDVILTSPLVRAVQTAEPLGKVFEREPQVLPVPLSGVLVFPMRRVFPDRAAGRRWPPHSRRQSRSRTKR